MTELVVRPLSAGEEHLFESMPTPPVGPVLLGQTYRGMLAAREYRPEWTWVALAGGDVVARAAWWGGPDDDSPGSLDWLDFTDFDAVVRILHAGPRTSYSLNAPPGWQADADLRRAVESRIAAAAEIGLTPLVERHWYRWTPADGLPERPGRLEFRPAPDDEVWLDIFERVHDGTLDAHARQVIAESGVATAARRDLAIMNWMNSPRDWWQLAHTPAGELVGFTIPADNHTDPVIGYIGVVPEHRGHGYAYDLLVEATWLLADHGVDRIIAATDTTNTPMAAAFAKAGYPVACHVINLA